MARPEVKPIKNSAAMHLRILWRILSRMCCQCIYTAHQSSLYTAHQSSLWLQKESCCLKIEPIIWACQNILSPCSRTGQQAGEDNKLETVGQAQGRRQAVPALNWRANSSTGRARSSTNSQMHQRNVLLAFLSSYLSEIEHSNPLAYKCCICL